MGKTIAIGLVIIIVVAIIAGVTVYFRRRQGKETALEHGWATKGDLSVKQEKALIAEINSAAILLRQLLAPPADLDSDMTYLRHEDRQRVETWLRQHNTSSGSNTRKAVEKA